MEKVIIKFGVDKVGDLVHKATWLYLVHMCAYYDDWGGGSTGLDVQ